MLIAIVFMTINHFTTQIVLEKKNCLLDLLIYIALVFVDNFPD